MNQQEGNNTFDEKTQDVVERLLTDINNRFHFIEYQLREQQQLAQTL